MTRLLRLTFILLGLLAVPTELIALTAGISVKTTLSHRVAEVGMPMDLEIQISGGEIDGREPVIRVDGLQIDFLGPTRSSRVEINNGRMKSSVDTTYHYQVIAEREGDFTIPALEVQVNGALYPTQPIALKVQKGSKGGSGTRGSDAISFAEMEVARKTAYVGEVVPVEVRLYIKGTVRAEIATTIDIQGDGFTFQKAPEPDQQTERRGDTDYYVFTYKTVMTPSKAGKLSVGPTVIPFVAQIPRTPQRQRRSFGGQVFDDFFDAFGGFTERKRFNENVPAVEIDVRPLPTEGRPTSFTGAVGTFSFQAEGSPTKLKVGDPVTMRLKVTGTGNFDRMTSPVMEIDKGWRAYEGSEKFDPVDPLKTTGTKTFELPVIPDGPHKETPVFTFSFFDPEKGKYITQRSRSQALTIEGVAAAAPAPVADQAESKSASELPEQKPAPMTDLAGLQYEIGTIRTFAPLYARSGFWMAQGIPALAILGLLAARLARRDPHRARHAALERQRDSAFSQLRSARNASDFWENAARVVQFDTAAAAGVEPGGVDPDVVRRVRALDPEMMAVIDEIFEYRGALLFAGRGEQASQLPPEQRSRIIAALEKLRRQ